jgi:ribosomal protein L24E
MKKKCDYCGGDFSDLPSYVIYDHSEGGVRYEFCSSKCLRSWVLRIR